MQGGSTPQDLETMFQLLYLRFTQPRADPAAFAAIAAQAKAFVANQNASPDIVFNRTIEEALSGSHPRRQPETPTTIDRWDLAKALAFYKARFADASNFTFVFVGSFTHGRHQAARRDLHRQPAGDRTRHETWRDLGVTPPTGKIEKTINIGIAPKSNVAIVLSGPFEYDASHKLAMRTVDDAAAVASVRHDPPGPRRNLQHHRDDRDAEVPTAAIRGAHRVDVRSGADRRRWCRECGRRSRSFGICGCHRSN